jgi:hypothetical protein
MLPKETQAYCRSNQRRRIPGLVMPRLKVGYLGSANGVQDSQDDFTGCFRNKGAVKTRATLLDCRKVKARRVGDRLHVGTGRKLIWRSVLVV